MGTTRDDRKPGAATGRAIVAFDFDGTLTTTDSFAQFLRWRSDWRDRIMALSRLAPAAARYLVRRDRGALKAAAFRAFVRSIDQAQLARETAAFAEGSYVRLIRKDALECWTAHGRSGDERVIVTASPELLVAPFAERLGADRLIGTRLHVDRTGQVTGALDGLNCRGAEKVRRLREVFGPQVRLSAAYGDTAGDREMLALADRPRFKVFKSSAEA